MDISDNSWALGGFCDASVLLEMDVEMALVREGLVAEVVVAFVGSFAGVQSVMGLKITLLEEGLPTARVRAVEVPLADVFLYVHVQPLHFGVRHPTTRVGALELSHISVDLLMDPEALRCYESFATFGVLAHVPLLRFQMEPLVHEQGTHVIESLATLAFEASVLSLAELVLQRIYHIVSV